MSVWSRSSWKSPYMSIHPKSCVQEFHPLGWIVIILIVFGLMVYFMDFPRPCTISIRYAVTVPTTEVPIEFTGIAIGYIVFDIASTIIIPIRLVVLSHLLQDHPLPAEEVEL